METSPADKTFEYETADHGVSLDTDVLFIFPDDVDAIRGWDNPVSPLNHFLFVTHCNL